MSNNDPPRSAVNDMLSSMPGQFTRSPGESNTTMSNYGGPLDASNTPADFGRSSNSKFRGRHVFADGSYTNVAKVPGGAGLTGDDQPEGD